MDVHFIFEGTGFLRYQVRMMTGTLIAVGQHKIGVDDVQRMLDAKDKSHVVIMRLAVVYI